MRTLDAVWVEGFHLLVNFHKLCQGFHQAMKARKTCFIYFKKSLFFVVTKRKTIYEACINFNFFHETANLTTWREPTILLTSFLSFIALWKHICWPIKTHVLSKIFYKQLYTTASTNFKLFLKAFFFLKFLSRNPGETRYSLQAKHWANSWHN